MSGAQLLTEVYAIVIALGLIVAFLGLLVFGLLRSHAEILKRLDSLGAGLSDGHDHGARIGLTSRPMGSAAPTPEIAGTTPDGESVVVAPLSGPEPTLVAFLSTSCSSCTPFWEMLDSPARYFGDHRHRVVIVTRGESEESPTRAQSLSRGDATVVMSSDAWDDYEVPGAPYFVVASRDAGGVIGEGTATNFPALEEFLRDAANDLGWDRRRAAGLDSEESEESRVDTELRAAGLNPGDPRLYHKPGDLPTEDGQ
jgi:hypothetical protein